MKILEVEDIQQRPYADLHDQAWFIALQNSIRDMYVRYPNLESLERDKVFEQENKCQVNYRFNSRIVRNITFSREQDYIMFILRWA